jgi:hypothetical protein
MTRDINWIERINGNEMGNAALYLQNYRMMIGTEVGMGSTEVK